MVMMVIKMFEEMPAKITLYSFRLRCWMMRVQNPDASKDRPVLYTDSLMYR